MLTIDLDARHIVGGDVTYQFKYYSPDSSQVTYDIFFNMYRDTESNGANFDQPGGVAGGARFAVYRKTSLGDWEFIWTTGELDLDANPVQIPIIDDPCRQEPDNVGVESGTYSFEVTLDVSEYEYMIAYQRCCRNPNVLNIFDSGGTGVAFNVIISPEAQSNGNSSAVFSEYPPIFVCAGFPMDIDVSGTDIDGDVLRYSFCTPSAAGGDAGGKDVCDGWSPDPLNCFPPFNDVVFINPYDASNPMGGSPPVTINPFTGQLTGVPDVIGQFVIGMCIEEFRNGQLIGVVSRDFQFNGTIPGK